MARDKNIALATKLPPHNRREDGQAYALNVLTPIRPGRETELRDLLEALPAGQDSPFARLPRTHFARLVIIDRLAFEGPPARKPELRLQYLLFSTVFDGALDDYLGALCARIPRKAETIWAGCVGAPQPVAADVGTFAAWIRHNQVQTDAFFAPYGHATVDRIKRSLDLCRRLREFARETQYVIPPELKKRFDEELRSRGSGA
jgi:hypothetical protein